jgi:solute:Na+ symporter, SSS family
VNIIDTIVIAIFSLLILGAGLSFGNQGKDLKSFFAAGGNVPWGINGLSLFMSFFSAGTFVVWGSIAYQHGFVAVTIQWMMAIGGLFIGVFIAPRWKRANALTAGDFLRRRFGASTQRNYTFLILLLSLAYTGAFLYPVAKMVNVSTGLSIETSIIVLGLMVIVYTAVGGLWAVVITDVLQFVVLTAAVVIVVPLSFAEVGGVNEFLQKAPDAFFDLTTSEYSGSFLFAFALYNMVFIGGNWAYIQRYTTVRTERSASKVAYLFAGLYLVSPLLWMLPPMLYRLIDVNLQGNDNEGAYLMMCKTVLPAGMLGLMLSGMIFATASSVNTTLNLVAAVFTNDVYRPLRPRVTERHLMNIARLSTVVFGLITILVALVVPSVGGIVEVVLTVGAVTGCSIYGPPIWALFSQHQTGKTIWASTFISLVINLFFKFAWPHISGMSLSRENEMLLGALTPFFLLLIFEILGRAKNVKTASNVESEPGAELTASITSSADDNGDQNRFGVRVLAICILVVSLIIVGLGLLHQEGALTTMTVGAIVSSIGVFMLVKIYRS